LYERYRDKDRGDLAAKKMLREELERILKKEVSSIKINKIYALLKYNHPASSSTQGVSGLDGYGF
jgi:hypothetical protein